MTTIYVIGGDTMGVRLTLAVPDVMFVVGYELLLMRRDRQWQVIGTRMTFIT